MQFTVSGGGGENEPKLKTVITRKRLKITLSIWHSSLLNRARRTDWNRFRDARMKYKGVIVCKGRNLDREKYGVKGNGGKPSQGIAGTEGNMERTNGKGESSKKIPQ